MIIRAYCGNSQCLLSKFIASFMMCPWGNYPVYCQYWPENQEASRWGMEVTTNSLSPEGCYFAFALKEQSEQKHPFSPASYFVCCPSFPGKKHQNTRPTLRREVLSIQYWIHRYENLQEMTKMWVSKHQCALYSSLCTQQENTDQRAQTRTWL